MYVIIFSCHALSFLITFLYCWWGTLVLWCMVRLEPCPSWVLTHFPCCLSRFSPLSLEARFFLGSVLVTCKSQERPLLPFVTLFSTECQHWLFWSLMIHALCAFRKNNGYIVTVFHFEVWRMFVMHWHVIKDVMCSLMPLIRLHSEKQYVLYHLIFLHGLPINLQ